MAELQMYSAIELGHLRIKGDQDRLHRDILCKTNDLPPESRLSNWQHASHQSTLIDAHNRLGIPAQAIGKTLMPHQVFQLRCRKQMNTPCASSNSPPPPPPQPKPTSTPCSTSQPSNPTLTKAIQPSHPRLPKSKPPHAPAPASKPPTKLPTWLQLCLPTDLFTICHKIIQNSKYYNHMLRKETESDEQYVHRVLYHVLIKHETYGKQFFTALCFPTYMLHRLMQSALLCNTKYSSPDTAMNLVRMASDEINLSLSNPHLAKQGFTADLGSKVTKWKARLRKLKGSKRSEYLVDVVPDFATYTLLRAGAGYPCSVPNYAAKPLIQGIMEHADEIYTEYLRAITRSSNGDVGADQQAYSSYCKIAKLLNPELDWITVDVLAAASFPKSNSDVYQVIQQLMNLTPTFVSKSTINDIDLEPSVDKIQPNTMSLVPSNKPKRRDQKAKAQKKNGCKMPHRQSIPDSQSNCAVETVINPGLSPNRFRQGLLQPLDDDDDDGFEVFTSKKRGSRNRSHDASPKSINSVSATSARCSPRQTNQPTAAPRLVSVHNTTATTPASNHPVLVSKIALWPIHQTKDNSPNKSIETQSTNATVPSDIFSVDKSANQQSVIEWSCCICLNTKQLEHFRAPVPCGHTLCVECVSQLQSHSSTKPEFTCPTCQQNVTMVIRVFAQA